MSEETPSVQESSGRRRLGAVAQVLGLLGIVVGLLAAVAAAAGAVWVRDRVDRLASAVDGSAERSATFLAAARDRVGGVSALVKTTTEEVRARVAAAGSSPRGQDLAARAAELSDRYLGLRAAYADAHEKAHAALERVRALADAVPALSPPPALAEALGSLDAYVLALDSSVMRWVQALEPGTAPVDAAVADAGREIGEHLEGLVARLADATTRLEELRHATSKRIGRLRSGVVLVAGAVFLASLYVAFLHVVLFRTGSRMRRAG